MGEVATKICGGQGPLDWLIKNYGDDIGKFIAIEKVKQLLDGKIGSLKSTIGTQSDSILSQLFGVVDTKKAELTNTFQNYKHLIDEKVPGGISSLEKIKGEPIEQMLGLNGFLQKFDEVKATANTRFAEEQQNVFTLIDKTGQQQKENLNSQRPKVPIYDSMSEKQQQIVFKEGEKVFAKQIQEHQDTMLKQLGDKLNPDTYLGNFKNLVPMGSLDGILGSATNKFETVKNMISGGGFSSFAQGINAIF